MFDETVTKTCTFLTYNTDQTNTQDCLSFQPQDASSCAWKSGVFLDYTFQGSQ